MKRRTLSQKRADAGRKGGSVTRDRYGKDYMREIAQRGGRKGGRPRRLTYSQLKEHQLLIDKEENKLPGPASKKGNQ